jgi:hypothetical protein
LVTPGYFAWNVEMNPATTRYPGLELSDQIALPVERIESNRYHPAISTAAGPLL